MSLLVVGSMAFDSIRSPFGEGERVGGGSATYSRLAASYLVPVRLVSVVGTDFPAEVIRTLASRSIDLAGLKVSQGKKFHWTGVYEDPPSVFLGNIAPALQLDILRQVRRPKLVALDTMNYWIESSPGPLREVIGKGDILMVNEGEIRMLTGEYNLVKAARQGIGGGPGG